MDRSAHSLSARPVDLSAPSQLFARDREAWRAERVALARQRFFEDGERPSGLVGEAVIQSWTRLRVAHCEPQLRPAFNPVSASRLHTTLARNRALLSAAERDIAGLEDMLSGTGCCVLLTDAQGVIVHATRKPLSASASVLLHCTRVGVNIAEASVGTSAPGLAAKTGQAVAVNGGEHFYDCLREMRCAAVPIRDARGQIAAVLDLSIENDSFGFDAAAVVASYASSIENRLLQSQADEHLLLRFHSHAALLATPLAALLGVDSSGRVAWFNGAAAALLGCSAPAPQAEARSVEQVLGCDLRQLLALVQLGAPRMLRLPGGLGVWAQARAPLNDGADLAHGIAFSLPAQPEAAEPPVAAEPEPTHTFAGLSRQLIEQALQTAGGNISRAARSLGVSRGLLYRRLQRWRKEEASA